MPAPYRIAVVDFLTSAIMNNTWMAAAPWRFTFMADMAA
jgi:hypothetical protein